MSIAENPKISIAIVLLQAIRDAVSRSQRRRVLAPHLMITVVDGMCLSLTSISQRSYEVMRDECRYAVERTSTYIKIFFWPRNSYSVPDEVKNGSYEVHPDNWVS